MIKAPVMDTNADRGQALYEEWGDEKTDKEEDEKKKKMSRLIRKERQAYSVWEH